MSKQIATAKKRLDQEKNIATSEYLNSSLALCTLDQNGKSTIPKYLKQIQMLKDRISKIGQDLVGLKLLSNEISSLDKLLSQENLSFSEQDLQRLMELLVHEVLVNETFIGINLFLSTFGKEMNAS
nr:hypothetical protein [Heyndrickxia oleronia]